MNCENCFCVYQHNEQCTLDEIELDSMGLCKECVYIDVDNKDLERKKQEMKDKLRRS